MGGDGEELDAYLLGVYEPVKEPEPFLVGAGVGFGAGVLFTSSLKSVAIATVTFGAAGGYAAGAGVFKDPPQN